MSASPPIAIIGAGPYRLSIAAHLDARGIEHRIFGNAMRSWCAHMPKGMVLKSEAFTSNLYDPDGRYHRNASKPGASARIPAVVVGAVENAGGLGIVRSLGRGDVPLVVVDTDPYAPAMRSRFGRRVVVSQLSGPSLVRDLLALNTATDAAPVLFLTSDDAALTVSAHRAELQGRYRFRLPSHDRLVSLMHKAGFQQLAETHGFPVPRSVRIERAADLARLAELRFPCIIKPAIKSADYLASRFERAYKAMSIEQAQAVCGRILPILPDLLVQEWIAGEDSDLYFCLLYRASGATLCSFTGRKLSIWPPDVGTTASCVAAPHAHPILAPLTEAFFEAVSFVGMGGIEFKRDARTGQFLMIEPTVGRVDWQEEVATINGANIPLAAYCHEIGLDVPPIVEPAVPMIWCDHGRHWKSARNGRREFVAPPRARVVDPYWRLEDPMPALFYILRALITFFRRALRRRQRHP